MYDTIIIGAGMSGLAAGIRLAHFGRRVCILERHTTVGGLNSFYRLRGRLFDVGLHAVTNFARQGGGRGPLARLLRQLRLGWEDFPLAPQAGSAIAFPGVSLAFGNEPALLESEIAREFPRQTDGFRRLVAQLDEYDQLGRAGGGPSARQVASSLIDDPLLVDMILCPLLYYGGASANDMPFSVFSVLFRSIYLEGLGRPFDGIRPILRALVRRYRHLGGELRLRSGVQQMVTDADAVQKLILDDGAELTARNVLSSAGWPETARLCTGGGSLAPQPGGQLSFFETISILNAQPRDLGLDRTIVFFNDSPTFRYQKPEELVDLHSGVVCSPNNFLYEKSLPEGSVRMTAQANFERWAGLDESAYREAKQLWYDRLAVAAARFVPDFRPAVVESDVFTPVTIRRFTGRENGAVYGTPEKRYDGTTHLRNLYLCGTDQGLVGVVGALISGITVANKHLLK